MWTWPWAGPGPWAWGAVTVCSGVEGHEAYSLWALKEAQTMAFSTRRNMLPLPICFMNEGTSRGSSENAAQWVLLSIPSTVPCCLSLALPSELQLSSSGEEVFLVHISHVT